MNDDVKYSRAIKDISVDDRPREKALKHGVSSLSPAELLAVLIGSGTPGESVVDLSQRILQNYDNSLQKLGASSIGDLKRKFKGVGEAKAITILAAMRLAQLYSSENYEAAQICTPQAAYDLMKSDLAFLNHEEFWVVALNRSKRVISRMKIAQGGVSSTTVDPKIVLKMAIDNLASSIILYHNHPSGNYTPSNADDDLTRKIQRAAAYLDIPVDDHIIVCSNGYFSYMESGRF